MKKKINLSVFISIIVYPFLPLIKEWNKSIGQIIEIIILFLLLFSFTRKINRKIELYFRKQNIVYIVFFAIYTIVGYKEISSALSSFRCFILFLLYYLMLEKEEYEIIINTIKKAATLTTVIMTIGCITQYIFPEIIKGFHTEELVAAIRGKTDFKPYSEYNRAVSFMNDPNVLGTYLFFSYALIKTLGNRINITSKRFLMILIVIGILLTKSRTAISLLVIYYIINILKKLFVDKKLSKFGIIIFIPLCFFIIFYIIKNFSAISHYYRFDTLFNGNGRFDNNVINIDDNFTDIIKIFLGNGLFDGRSIIFENTYILCLYMFGVLGSIVFMYIMYANFKSLVKNNIIIIILFLLSNYVGDYLLIPQITIMFISICQINSYKAM